jgi:hypothetical protein
MPVALAGGARVSRRCSAPMRITHSSLAMLGIIGACALPPAASAQQARLLDSAQAQRLVTDPAAAQSAVQAGNVIDVAWSWFIALNSPLTGVDPKVWEGWRQTSTVYLANGQAPPPWGQAPAPPAAVIAAAQKQGLNTNLPFHNLDSDLQVDGLALRDNFNQNVRYQLLMNQDTFEYIVSNGIYNVNGQQAMAQANKPADFPPTAFELKTSWIWIGTNQSIFNQLNGKYYIVNAYYALVDGSGKPNGLYKVGRAALSGMHIISKPVPQWVWTTFQNVYDAQYTKATNKLPIPAAVQQANQKYRAALKKAGSIFANYQLMGTQWQFVDAAGKPILLANSQIESAFQLASSCATCHSTASYSPANGYFNIVKQQNGGITYYTGTPPAEQLKGYNPLDFVWSLKRAQWLRPQ